MVSNADNTNKPFWESKTLSEMNPQEWESLCDGCAKCCLHKLEDDETGLIHYTSVVCRYLDQKKCHCTVYKERRKLVPDCLKLEPGELDGLGWMPNTCAYRLLNEGKPLPIWHPLISGNRQAMIDSGNTVTGKVISEEYVHEDGLDEHVINWAN
ncbi:YcgN family cysteine cluster protein [Gammaproteobacteria bacterium]|nr:YcgN family cysteine cluster protein [Gammaproteobacteria bacterium]